MTVRIRVPFGSSTAVVPGVTIAAADIDSDAVETVKIAASAVTTAKIASNAVTAAKIASDAVTTVKILDANVTTAKIADANVTAAKLANAALVFTGFTGKNLAGACTLTGAKVGDIVLGVVSITDGGSAAASFETTITVADQIQQSAASDLSTKKFSTLLLKKGA